MGKNKCLFALFVIVVFFFVCLFINLFFFSIWISFHQNSRFSVQREKGEAISITPFYHFHQFHIRLDISEAITAERSPLRKASSRTRTGKLWCPSAGRQPLSYSLLKPIAKFSKFNQILPALEYCHNISIQTFSNDQIFPKFSQMMTKIFYVTYDNYFYLVFTSFLCI